MTVSNNTTLYQDSEILMVTTHKNEIFAGEVVGKFRGAVQFYDVFNSVTGKIHVVTQDEVRPFRVIARNERGHFFVATLRFRLGDTFIAEANGRTVEVCKDCVVRVLTN